MDYHKLKKLYKFQKEVFEIASSLFQYILILFLITLILREFFKDYVDHYVNITYFMIIVIIIGAISIFTSKEKPHIKEIPKKSDYLLILILGIIGAILVFLKLKGIGWIAYLISPLSGFLIIALSYMLLNDEDNNL